MRFAEAQTCTCNGRLLVSIYEAGSVQLGYAYGQADEVDPLFLDEETSNAYLTIVKICNRSTASNFVSRNLKWRWESIITVALGLSQCATGNDGEIVSSNFRSLVRGRILFLIRSGEVILEIAIYLCYPRKTFWSLVLAVNVCKMVKMSKEV